MSSAPRDFVVWAVFDRQNFQEMIQTAPIEDIDKLWSKESSAPALALVTGRFDPYKKPTQEYPLRKEAEEILKARNLPVEDVVFQFLNNWGNEDWTCIYRVRVFGVIA